MSKTRFTQWIVLACMGAVAACTSGEGDTVGNTEVNVVVPNGAPSLGGGSSAPSLIDIQSVEYTINCLGNDSTFLENNASFPDQVTVDGNLEVVDGRTNIDTNPNQFGTARPGDGAEVWQAFMDLPPGPCTIQLRARDNDGEVICSADEPFFINADTLTKVNLVLVCDVSFQAPVGMLDVDATFSFVVSNFCPDLIVFNTIDSDPQVQTIPVPPTLPLPPSITTLDLALTTMEVRFRDGDNTCGDSCDPQACTPIIEPSNGSVAGIDCEPACVATSSCPAEPTTTITCSSLYCDGGANAGAPCFVDAQCPGSTCGLGLPQSALLDCNGDLIPDPPGDPNCTYTGTGGNFLGIPAPELLPSVACVVDSDCGVPGAVCDGGFCDFTAANPALNATAAIACAPLADNQPTQTVLAGLGIPAGQSGAVITCTAVTTDGDEDCDKVKQFTLTCPGLTPCAQLDADNGGGGTQAGADALCNGATVTECVTSVCVDGGCDGTLGNCCVDSNVPDSPTTACTTDTLGNPVAPPASCIGGECISSDCNVVGCPPSTNQCLQDALCTVGPACDPQVPFPSGTACDAGAGATSGACDGVDTCVDICTFNPACPDDGNVCTVPSCDPADGTCSLPAGNEGGTCDFNPGQADGICQSGTCIFAPDTCNFAQTGSDAIPQTGIVGVACTNSVTTAQSPFPFTLIVDVPVPVVNGSPFTASFDGVGVFPEFFLDAAQGVVPGGVAIAELVDIVSTVQVRSGATGADVPLGPDTSSLTPGAVLTCDIPAGQVCLVDLDCAGGFGNCNIPVVLAELPTSTDCTAGGACDTIGKGNVGSLCGDGLTPCTVDADCAAVPAPDDVCGFPSDSQCAQNGFCITGDLVIEFLDSGPQPFTATGGIGGQVLFGWSDGVGAGTTPVPGLTLCPAPAPACTDAFMPDGCYDLPAAVFANPTAPIGIRVNASGLFVPIQCAQAEPGGICASGEGCLVDADCGTAPCTITTDVVCPTPDTSLITCPIN